MCAKRISSHQGLTRVGLTYRLNLHCNSMRLQMCMDKYWRVRSPRHSLGPGWSWPSLQRAGSSASQWAEAERGAAWRAPTATPSQGRSEKTGHDSIMQSPSHYSRDSAFKSQQACSQNKIYNGFNHILNLMKSTTDCKAYEIYSRWQQILFLVVWK